MWPDVKRRVRTLLRVSLFRVGAALGFIQAYGVPVALNRGPAGRWWEPLRRRASVLLGELFDGQAGPRPVTVGEYAGRIDSPVRDTEQLLWRCGFQRNPFARLKTREGQPEAGSWVYRERPLADRQLHLMLFPGSDGGTDVYAHEEPSSVNPALAISHVDGDSQSLAAGVERARQLLPVEATDAPGDPPAGPWTASDPHESDSTGS